MNRILASVLFLILVSSTYSLELGRNISPSCSVHISYYFNQLNTGSLWALQMLDSTTKVPDGLLYGNVYQFGNFDECLSVRVSEDGQQFQGQYCSTRLTVVSQDGILANGTVLQWALCVPSSCSPDDVTQLVHVLAPSLLPQLNVTAQVVQESCYVTRDHAPFEAGTIAVLTLEGVLVILVIVSTALGYFWSRWTNHIYLSTKPEQSHWWSLLEPWNGRETARRLFSTTPDAGALHCLHGIRACSMLWILLGHRTSDVINGPLSNKVPAMQVYKKPFAMTIVNAYVAVDTFLLLSGLLICYTSMRDIQRYKSFRLIKFYVYRYLRLSVPYAFIILYYIFIQPHVGYGPIWREDEGCKNYWWSALTYTQNYNEFGKYCVTQTWYLAVDMQLAFLSPLVIIPLYYSKKAGIQILSILILISCFIPFTVAYINELFWAYHGTNVWDNYLFTTIMYFPTHTRASPYLCGILLGYFLFKTKGLRIEVSRIWLVIGWCLTTFASLTIVFSLCLPYQPGFQYHKLDSAFYNGFHHLGWSASVSWIIFACVNDYGGVVNKILSWKFFLPLSRLTYAAYLSQFLIITYDVNNSRNPNYFTYFQAVRKFLGDLPMVLGISMFLYFTVEGPLMVILKQIFTPKAKQNPPVITVTQVD